jgi:hypothetical protein
MALRIPRQFDARPPLGDSIGIINGRLVIEFKAREGCILGDIPAGTLVCDPFTSEEIEQWKTTIDADDLEDWSRNAYPEDSCTVEGTLFHCSGTFTPRVAA